VNALVAKVAPYIEEAIAPPAEVTVTPVAAPAPTPAPAPAPVARAVPVPVPQPPVEPTQALPTPTLPSVA
jgi:hypothetical protein